MKRGSSWIFTEVLLKKSPENSEFNHPLVVPFLPCYNHQRRKCCPSLWNPLASQITWLRLVSELSYCSVTVLLFLPQLFPAVPWREGFRCHFRADGQLGWPKNVSVKASRRPYHVHFLIHSGSFALCFTEEFLKKSIFRQALMLEDFEMQS